MLDRSRAGDDGFDSSSGSSIGDDTMDLLVCSVTVVANQSWLLMDFERERLLEVNGDEYIPVCDPLESDSFSESVLGTVSSGWTRMLAMERARERSG